MSKTKVLVVDDARLVRMFVKKSFRNFPDFIIEEAEDGLQAQSLLKDGSFDIVLCDWDMPQMSGEELLIWMRAHDDERLKTLPFVMVTSSGEKEKVVQAVKGGVSGYVVKPFSSSQLLRQVRDILAKRQETGRKVVRQSKGYPIQVRFAGGALELHAQNVTGKGFIGRAWADAAMPGILSPVVADLQISGDEKTVSFPGYIFRLEAAEDSPKPKQLNIGVRFIEVSAEKKEFLVDFIAALRC